MARTPRLDATYERVDAWVGPGDAQGWELVEESEALVVLDTGGTDESAKMGAHVAPGTDVSLTGLETSTPMLKIDGTVFQGEWDRLFGSEIVLEEGRRTTYPATSTNDTHDRALHPVPSLDAPRHTATGASSTTGDRIVFVPVREADEPPLDVASARDAP